MMTQTSSRSPKISFMKRWEDAGAFERPKGMTSHSKEPIASAKSGLPFITFSDADKVISVAEVKRCVNTSLAGCIEEVRNEWKWVPVFLSDFVKTTVVNTKSEGAILFVDKENGSSMRRARVSNETNS